MRWIAVAAAVAACGDTMPRVDAGPVRAIAAYGESQANLAVAMPGGDWIVSDDHGLARRGPDGRVRWRLRVGLVGAIVVGDGIVGVGVDPTGRRAAIAVSGDGHVRWTAVTDTITRAASERVVRAGDVTFVANDYGELVLDDDGHVLWEHANRDSRQGVLADFAADVGAIVVTTPGVVIGTELPSHVPCVVQVLDPATGAERVRVARAGDDAYCAVDELARLGDRIVLRFDDVALRRADGVTHVENHPKVAVFDTRVGKLLDAFDEPAQPELLPALPKLGPDTAVFLGRYAAAQDRATLSAIVVDVAARRERRVSLIRPLNVHVGGGDMSSFVQLLWTGRSPDRIVFAGIFDGELAIGSDRLRAPVSEVDACAAARHIECVEGRGTAFDAPFEAVFGSIQLAR
ncbi:MAG TPA: hypothetical protein VMJ10_37205 [Kofleriaceae bacterium]|nr:hypothetical protein [Kofleriaceae bacterium]